MGVPRGTVSTPSVFRLFRLVDGFRCGDLTPHSPKLASGRGEDSEEESGQEDGEEKATKFSSVKVGNHPEMFIKNPLLNPDP